MWIAGGGNVERGSFGESFGEMVMWLIFQRKNFGDFLVHLNSFATTNNDVTNPQATPSKIPSRTPPPPNPL